MDTNHDKLQTSLGVTQLLNLTILVYFGITRRYTSVCVLGGQKCKKHVDFGEHHFLKRTSLVSLFCVVILPSDFHLESAGLLL